MIYNHCKYEGGLYMRILLLADIHIGSIKDSKYVYDIITGIIDNELILTHSDMVVILGDYFDRLCKVNEDCVSLAIDVMSYLIRACVRENTKIRIVYGTESHEMNQYKLFNYHFTSSNVDIKIFDTVTEECINGHPILYVPEEYVSDNIKHYSKFMNSSKRYDYVFGHGIIEDGMPSIVSSSHEKMKTGEKQVLKFKSGQLSAISKICVFGHYHVHTKMDGDVYYLGSLFRNSFGEEVPKYYGIINDDKIEFIENKDAYVYKTYEFDHKSDIYDSSDRIIDIINQIKSDNADVFNGDKFGKIRLVLNMPMGMDASFKDNLRNILANESQIVSLIKEPNDELLNDIKENLDDEYDWLIDPSLDVVDKLYRYISMNPDNHITLDQLKKYLK